MHNYEEYYKLLYKKITSQTNGIFSNCDAKKLVDIRIEGSIFEKLYSLLDTVESKYEFDLQKTLLPNYKKFVLWQKVFLGGVDNAKILVATEFIVFCCLVDKFLDSNRFSKEEKEHICQKIKSNNFTSASVYESTKFVELDLLLNDIRLFILNERGNSSEKKELLNAIDKALISEEYMYRNPLVVEDGVDLESLHYLTDKSVEFEKAAFMISVFGNNTDKTMQAAINVGKIFWLVDDLCDIPEDIEYKRKNSLLFLKMQLGLLSIEERMKNVLINIDEYIKELIENLEGLKVLAGKDFYEYIVNDIWEWCLGIRKLADETIDKNTN